MMHKICPRCGSTNQCVCKDCDYTGPIVEGNDEFAEEIRENYKQYLKEQKEE